MSTLELADTWVVVCPFTVESTSAFALALSAAFTVTGGPVTVVSKPPRVDCAWNVQLVAPLVVEVTTAAPLALTLVLPYRIVIVPAAATVTPVTVITCPDADAVPVEEVV